MTSSHHHEHHHPRDEPRHAHGIEIKIDRKEYKVHQSTMTGAQLRALAEPPIGPDRDLFQVVPGGSDRKIGNDETVALRDGMRFFTAPAQINPGQE